MSASFSPGVQIVQTETEAARAAERARHLAESNARDVARDATRMVRVQAIVAFEIHDNIMHESPRTILPGDQFEVREYDVDRGYKGKVFRILPDGTLVAT